MDVCSVKQLGGNASLIGMEGSSTRELVSGKLKVFCISVMVGELERLTGFQTNRVENMRVSNLHNSLKFGSRIWCSDYSEIG